MRNIFQCGITTATVNIVGKSELQLPKKVVRHLEASIFIRRCFVFRIFVVVSYFVFQSIAAEEPAENGS